MIWVGDDAFCDRAYRLTSRLLIVTFTLSTQIWVDLEDLTSHRNGTVRALWVAHIAVNALVGNEQRHRYLPVGLRVSCPEFRLRISSA